MKPRVTFLIPCYNLGHLLAECVDSILTQSYKDFEVLILDDCSPDNTPEVARSFADPRVTHIRNETNLGHLRNYNKGIGLARGEYVWLISADDRLRTPRALERYVRMLDAHPDMGFACCPAIEMRDGEETGPALYSVLCDRDTVFAGHDFLDKLLYMNVVIASSGIVRKSCYEKHGAFPLDLPFAGDWYLWCLFAMYYQVGYVAEPLVNYRGHDLSMTRILKRKSTQILIQDRLAVLQRVKNIADNIGARAIAKTCRNAVANQYARFVSASDDDELQMNMAEFEGSLSHWAGDRAEADSIRARFHAALGDIYFSRGDCEQAKEHYGRALRVNPFMVKTQIKWLLFHTGRAGIYFRNRRLQRRSSAELSLSAKCGEPLGPHRCDSRADVRTSILCK